MPIIQYCAKHGEIQGNGACKDCVLAELQSKLDAALLQIEELKNEGVNLREAIRGEREKNGVISQWLVDEGNKLKESNRLIESMKKSLFVISETWPMDNPGAVPEGARLKAWEHCVDEIHYEARRALKETEPLKRNDEVQLRGHRDEEKAAISTAKEIFGIDVGFYGPCPCAHHKAGSDKECRCCGFDIRG